MKKKLSLLLAIVMLVTLLPTAFAESKTIEARKTSQKLTLDGKEVKVGFYNINNSNYIKLRDLAAMFNGTEMKFDVAYDKENNSFIILKGRDYKKVKGDLEELKDEKAKAKMSVKNVLINHNPKGSGIYQEKSAQTAFINGNNYLKLRDLADLVGFSINYDKKTSTIQLESKYGDDPSYDGFITSEFTEDDEKIFKSIEGLYNAMADDNTEDQYKYTRELTFNNLSDEECKGYISQMKNLVKYVNITKYNKDYKAEKRIENYANGKGYMVFFNSPESTITLDFFKPESGVDYMIGINNYEGDHYKEGYADDYYKYKDLNFSLNTAPVWTLHYNYAKKDYDAAYENFKSLGLDGDKDKMMKYIEEKTKGFDVLKDKYTYTSRTIRFFANTILLYTFDYGTKDQLEMQYNYSPSYVSLSITCRTKDEKKEEVKEEKKEEVKEEKKEEVKEDKKEEVKEDKKEDTKEVKEEKDTKVEKENK